MKTQARLLMHVNGMFYFEVHPDAALAVTTWVVNDAHRWQTSGKWEISSGEPLPKRKWKGSSWFSLALVSDVIRFEQTFAVSGMSPEVLLEAA